MFGFLSGKRVYLHVRRNNRTKGRFSLGKTKGACGLVTKKMRFMPVVNYRTGTYRYDFSHSKRFSKTKAVYQAKVRIYRTFSIGLDSDDRGRLGLRLLVRGLRSGGLA